tara:strand:- start:177 stop:371 length:195 start_codon:yes stop_codon:yes gene_type:complete
MNARHEKLKKEGYRLEPIGLFQTYETIEELQEYIEGFSNDDNKALAQLIMSLTWNTCAHLTKGE